MLALLETWEKYLASCLQEKITVNDFNAREQVSKTEARKVLKFQKV
jgi:hypothetical protein